MILSAALCSPFCEIKISVDRSLRFEIEIEIELLSQIKFVELFFLFLSINLK